MVGLDRNSTKSVKYAAGLILTFIGSAAIYSVGNASHGPNLTARPRERVISHGTGRTISKG